MGELVEMLHLRVVGRVRRRVDAVLVVVVLNVVVGERGRGRGR